MPEDFYKRTATFRGIVLRDGVGLLSGILNPWDEYTGVPIGSRYIKSTGEEYRKIGTGDTILNWERDYPQLASSIATTSYFTSSNATITVNVVAYTVVATLTSTPVLNGTYELTLSGICRGGTALNMDVGFYQDATWMNSMNMNIPNGRDQTFLYRTVYVHTTAGSVNHTIQLKSLVAGQVATIKNSCIILRPLA